MSERWIYHITALKDWEKAIEDGSYSADTLAVEGFIHASTKAQVLDTANYLFVGKPGLVLLKIDSNKVAAEIKYEVAPNGLKFPHIYGSLNLEAVCKVINFSPDADGIFRKIED